MTAEIYAQDVYAIWEKSIIDLDNIIGTKPEFTDELSDKVSKLKEETIQQLLPYGKEHALQTEQDQKTWSNKLVMKMDKLASVPAWNNTMNVCYKHYIAINTKFGSLIASFNVITQYADYALLKKQLPDEAQRLGI